MLQGNTNQDSDRSTNIVELSEYTRHQIPKIKPSFIVNPNNTYAITGFSARLADGTIINLLDNKDTNKKLPIDEQGFNVILNYAGISRKKEYSIEEKNRILSSFLELQESPKKMNPLIEKLQKKAIQAILATQLATSGVSVLAQSQPTTTKTITQETAKTAADCIAVGGKQTHTANNGFVECVVGDTVRVAQNTTPTQNNNTSTSQKKSGKSGEAEYTPSITGGSLRMQSGNNDFSLEGVAGSGGNGVRATVMHNSGLFAVATEVIRAEHMKSAFLAAGYELSSDVTGVITVSVASKDAAHALGDQSYNGDISAASVSAAINYHNAFIRFLQENGQSTTLKTEGRTTYQVSQQDFDTFLRKTTVATNTITTSLWDAFARNTVMVGGRYDIGNGFQGTLSAGISNDKYDANKGVFEGDLAYYGGNWKGNVGVGFRDKRATISTGVIYQIDRNIAATLGILYSPAYETMPANTMGRLGIVYSFGNNPTRPHVRPSTSNLTAITGVREALANQMVHVDPSTLGKVTKVESKTVTTTELDTQKEAVAIDASSVTTKINPADGTVTVTFGSRTGWVYQYQIDNGAWVTVTGTTVTPQAIQAKAQAQATRNNTSFTTPQLTGGNHTISLREVNPQNNIAGTTITLPGLTIHTDATTVITNNVVATTPTTATIPLSLADVDGIKEYTCQVYLGGTPIGSAVAPTGGECHLTGLTPNTSYSMVEKALVAVKKADGTIEWKPGEVNTLFRTPQLPGVDSPTTITLSTSGVTTNSALAACNIVDLDGATGTCTLTGGAGGTSWAIGADKALTGLAAGTTYTITLVGTKQVKNPDNSFSTVAVNQTATFTTVTAGVDSPTTITLSTSGVTTNSALAACNIVDLDGATGTCTLTGGAGGTSWAIGADKALTGLAAGTTYTITLVGTKQVKNPDNSFSTVAVNQTATFTTVTAGVDSPTTITLSTSGVTTNSALAACNIVDLDGATGTCTLTGGAGGTSWAIGADKALTGLAAGTTYTITLVGTKQVKNPDNSFSTVAVNQTATFTTVTAGVDSPTTITLSTSGVTTNSALAACNIVDLDGATGTCTLTGGAGGTSWAIGADKALTGLAAGTTYTITLVGTKQVKNPDNSFSTVAVNQTATFTTVTAGVDSPTTITLSTSGVTTNSALAACNIVDLDGATGTCTLTGGAGGTSWAIGADKALTGLAAGTTYTITLVGTKQVKNPDNSFSTVAVNQTATFTTVTAGVDSPTTITLSTSGVTTNSALAACNIVDLDGATGTCTLTGGAGGTSWAIGADKALTGLAAGTTYTITLVGTKQVKNPDNSFSTVAVNQTATFTTVTAGVDSPTTITLSTSGVTTNSALAACNIVDLDGATGTCTLTGGAGGTSWAIGADKALTGLAAGTTYTITLVGTKQVKNPDNSFSTVAVNQTATFTTDNIADVTPPTITLNGSNPMNINIGSTYTESGATWSDAVDGSGTVSTITGTVNTSAEGTYTITYSKTDAAGNVGTTTRTVNVIDPTPTGSPLGPVTVGDMAGGSPITPFSVGGVTDPLGRAITYSASGLPAGLSINPSTGTISGMYDAFGDESFGITVTATPAGGAHSNVRSFTLTITDQG